MNTVVKNNLIMKKCICKAFCEAYGIKTYMRFHLGAFTIELIIRYKETIACITL